MITPEPMALPPCKVTFICTTAGFTFAITASRTASILLLVSCGTVTFGVLPGCKVATLLGLLELLVLPNCQPANRPVPKTSASTSARARIAPGRIPLLPLETGRAGVDGTGSGSNCPGAVL